MLPVYGTFEEHGVRRRAPAKWFTVAAVLVLTACVVTLVVQSHQLDDWDMHAVVLDASAPAPAPAPAPPAPAPAVGAPAPPPAPTAPLDPATIAAFVASLPTSMQNNINISIDPCSDFHLFACGAWEATAVIPSEKTSVSYTWDIAHHRLQDGLRTAMQADQGNVGNFYRACLDEDYVNSLGYTPVVPYLNLINSINDTKSLAQAVYTLHTLDMDVFFSWFVGTDHLNASRSIMYISKGGLNLPDKTYYTDTTPEYIAHRVAYNTSLVAGMKLLGFSDADAAQIALDTLAVETAMANADHDDDDLYKLMDVPPRYNQSYLLSQFPGFDWVTYFSLWGNPNLGVGDDLLSVTWPKWLGAMSSILGGQFPLPSLQNYLRAHVFNFFGPLLTSSFLDVLTTLDGDLYGTTSRQPRWRKCLGAAQHAMPMGVGQLFVDTMVTPDIKPAATSLVEEIRSAFNANLDTVSWMTPDVRASAKQKLAGINMMVAYPPTWPTYPFTCANNTYVGNSIAAFVYATNYEYQRLYRPVDRTEWDSSPAEINAFYQNGINGVFLPAGILQTPFFNTTASLAQNYGSIGAVMGHELTHGFDNTGRKYDQNGNRHPWWDDATIASFQSGAQCISDEFDAFVAAGVHVHGNDTLGENIADLGGLKTAYNAFVLKAGGNPAPNDRRTFWTSFAQSWCEVDRTKALRLQVLTDPHSPEQFRIIGPLSQLSAFSSDFSCPAGSPMNPPNKCVLW